MVVASLRFPLNILFSVSTIRWFSKIENQNFASLQNKKRERKMQRKKNTFFWCKMPFFSIFSRFLWEHFRATLVSMEKSHVWEQCECPLNIFKEFHWNCCCIDALLWGCLNMRAIFCCCVAFKVFGVNKINCLAYILMFIITTGFCIRLEITHFDRE